MLIQVISIWDLQIVRYNDLNNTNVGRLNSLSFCKDEIFDQLKFAGAIVFHTYLHETVTEGTNVLEYFAKSKEIIFSLNVGPSILRIRTYDLLIIHYHQISAPAYWTQFALFVISIV